MSAVPKLLEVAPARVDLRHATAAEIDRYLFGLSVPPVSVLLRGFFGKGWPRLLARRYRMSVGSVCHGVYGQASLPRSFFLDALAEYRDPVKSAAWERERRAAFERELAADKARRAACARWFELLLNGGAQLPSVNRWRAWKSGRVENFLGTADL